VAWEGWLDIMVLSFRLGLWNALSGNLRWFPFILRKFGKIKARELLGLSMKEYLKEEVSAGPPSKRLAPFEAWSNPSAAGPSGGDSTRSGGSS
jgi:hypothetical protein